MKVAITDLHRIVNEYLIQVIVPKLPNDTYKFGVSLLSNYITEAALNNLFGKYSDFAVMFGIVNDGMIDVDTLRDSAIKALKSCHGQSFVYMGYKFDIDDIEALYKITSSYAKP